MKYLYWMLLFVPVALAAKFMHAPALVVVGIGTVIVLDAESNWLEGAFLLLVYAIIAVAFFFY